MNKSIALVLCSASRHWLPRLDRRSPTATSTGSRARSIRSAMASNAVLQDKSHSGNRRPTTNRASDSHRRGGRRFLPPPHVRTHRCANSIGILVRQPSLPGDKEDDSHLSAKYVYKYDGKAIASKKRLRQAGSRPSRTSTCRPKAGGSLSPRSRQGGARRIEIHRDKAGNVIGQPTARKKQFIATPNLIPRGNWSNGSSAVGDQGGETQPTMQNSLEERFLTYLLTAPLSPPWCY